MGVSCCHQQQPALCARCCSRCSLHTQTHSLEAVEGMFMFPGIGDGDLCTCLCPPWPTGDSSWVCCHGVPLGRPCAPSSTVQIGSHGGQPGPHQELTALAIRLVGEQHWAGPSRSQHACPGPQRLPSEEPVCMSTLLALPVECGRHQPHHTPEAGRTESLQNRSWVSSANQSMTPRNECPREDEVVSVMISFADGHTASNAPDLFRPPKLSGAGPG